MLKNNNRSSSESSRPDIFEEHDRAMQEYVANSHKQTFMQFSNPDGLQTARRRPLQQQTANPTPVVLVAEVVQQQDEKAKQAGCSVCIPCVCQVSCTGGHAEGCVACIPFSFTMPKCCVMM